MKLDFTIPALYLTTVRRGTPIEASSPVFPNRSFAGEVTSVDSTVDPVTRSITVRAIIPNEQRDLVPGMLMTLNLLRNERDAIVISEEAIVPRGANTYVLVVNMSAEPYTAEQRLGADRGPDARPGGGDVRPGRGRDHHFPRHPQGPARGAGAHQGRR